MSVPDYRGDGTLGDWVLLVPEGINRPLVRCRQIDVFAGALLDPESINRPLVGCRHIDVFAGVLSVPEGTISPVVRH
jgi:hypothetical protein